MRTKKQASLFQTMMASFPSASEPQGDENAHDPEETSPIREIVETGSITVSKD